MFATSDYYYYYYDLYDDGDDEFSNQYDLKEDTGGETSFWKHLSFYELCRQCVLPGAWSTFDILAANLVLCVLFVVCK